MGDLILVLLITILICGAVPCVALSYVKRGGNERTNRRVFLGVALLLGTFFNCFLFPIYHVTPHPVRGGLWYGLFTEVVACFLTGILLAGALPYEKGAVRKTLLALLALNTVHILGGMGCRYLMEFGEVSNTYNFTAPNILVHLLAVQVLCVASWCLAVAEYGKAKKW